MCQVPLEKLLNHVILKKKKKKKTGIKRKTLTDDKVINHFIQIFQLFCAIYKK